MGEVRLRQLPERTVEVDHVPSFPPDRLPVKLVKLLEDGLGAGRNWLLTVLLHCGRLKFSRNGLN